MASSLSQIKHIVVLMFENRSFDNVLGSLYPQGTKNFEGVWNTQNANVWNGAQYRPVHGTDMIQPFPDPNEEYQFIYRQLYNDFKSAWPPQEPHCVPQMDGFVCDYATAPGKPQSPPNIMNYFEPADVPVISGLATGYAVCDHWFCSIPSQTLCNRSFIQAGTSSGYVNNTWPGDGVFLNASPTIYNLLSRKHVNWRVYSGGGWFMSNTLLTQIELWGLTGHFFDLAQFYTDIQSEATFPSYIFLEPNYLWMDGNPENDEHPEAGLIDNPQHPSNVLYGEQLLFDIFTALTKSPAWSSTLFVVLFDEHGGTFDHVVPPKTVSPDGIVIPTNKPGGSNFAFDRLGVRVPAVVVSPLIASGTISSLVYDHTSVIRTVMETFGIPGRLLKREAQANDLSSVIGTTLRTDIPTITPRPVPPATQELSNAFANVPLTEFQRTMVRSAMRFTVRKAPAAAAAIVEPQENIQTHADAWRVLRKMNVASPSLR